MRHLVLLTCGLLASSCSSPVFVPEPAGPPPANQQERMGWWRQARFGMFIHWGLYAIPAGSWNGQHDYGEWIRHSAQIPRDTYAEFQPQWNPVCFDPDAWVAMAQDAGMQYLVITSKHHDGFCLWDSAQTDWDVGDTPHGRDILAGLAEACHRRGIAFGTYHSIMDWHHDDYLPRRGWEAAQRPVAGADFGRYERYLHAQVTELIERYRPAIMWFDGEWESTWNHERGRDLFARCRELAPEMLVNNRVDVHRGGMGGFSQSDEACGDFATPEQEIPATGIPGVDWESCMTMNRHWGWNKSDTQWKSASELVRNLIDIASKGGNYLLNVGPTADGSFPDAAVERLMRIGEWMRPNGEAIHGTTASVFDDLPFGRCTVRAGDVTRLYLHVFDWPGDGELNLPGLGNEALRAFRLDRPDQPLSLRREASAVVVSLPAVDLDPIATVVVVEVEGAPIVYRRPVITAEWPEFVTSTTAVVDEGPGLAARYTLDGSAPTAQAPVAAGPIVIDRSCTLRACAFHEGVAVSEASELRFTKVTPREAVQTLVAPAPGVQRVRLAADWDRIDEAAFGQAAAGEVANEIACGPNPGERVALRFTGFLDVPATELYRFALASDDGSKLWIGDGVVVDNDGLHGAVEQRGAAALARGLHPFTVVWFNKTGGAELRLRWATPGGAFEAIPAGVLRH